VRRFTPIRPSVTESKLLTVTGEFHHGFARWKKIFGVWSCIEADPSLKWMIGKTPAAVHLELIRLEVDYRWEGLSEELCGGVHPHRSSAPASPTNDAAVRPVSSHSGSGNSVTASDNQSPQHGTPMALDASLARPVRGLPLL
jgi:hypothetical protein